jgi:hypothetical protein
MSERKPPGMDFETWVDRQIREATERGEFDDLPGQGAPIRDLDRPRDELWWVRQKMEREELSSVPPALALRREAEDALAAVARAPSARDVRRILEAVNARIREGLRTPADPPVSVMPFDVEHHVREWHAHHDPTDG